MAELTAHSEIGQIHTVVMKRPIEAFISQEFLDKQWQALNYLQSPSMDQAIAEYEVFEELVRTEKAQIQWLPSSDGLSLDSIYCRDAALMTNFGAILCRMGKGQRSTEPDALALHYRANNMEVFGTIESPGTLEGGDVAWLDEQTLAVGHTYRTNYEGIDQLEALLAPKGIEVLIAEMPHYRGAQDVFHMMSVLSPVDRKKAVVYSPLLPIHFREELLNRDYQLIEVPDDEFESMGCNVLAISPSQCVAVAGNPITQSRMEAAGCKVRTYSGQHVSVAGGGGPTCLTRPLWRHRV